MKVLSRDGAATNVRIAAAGGLVALAAGALPGCIVVADGTKTIVVSDPAVDQAKLDRIRLGETTEPQARELLGPPTTRAMNDDGSQTWTFRGASRGGGTVVYINEHDEKVRTERAHAGRVVVEFRDGVATAVRRE